MAREPEAVAELRRSLGTQLATFRLAAELTQGQLAKIALCDRTTIVHIEKGRARADERFWQTVDAACDAGGAILAAYFELEAAKNEHENREREQRLSGVRAKAAELRGRSSSAITKTASDNSNLVDVPRMEELRRAILGHQPPPEPSRKPPTLPQLEALTRQTHRLYQRADYDAAAQLLSLTIGRIETSTVTVPLPVKAAAYLAAAKLATKVGDNSLSWISADRCLRLASDADRLDLFGLANYQISCALLQAGHLADAEQTATETVEHIASLASSTPSNPEDIISTQGALLLLLAIIAARCGERQKAVTKLRDAARLAEQLGRDGNRLWTAFGPTNIAIHELAVLVALGDSRTALKLGERIDTDTLPAVLRGRRSQVHLELGWASARQGDDGLTVLHLLEAERVAKQAVARNVTARTLLTTLLARERTSTTPGLRALATRAGVI